MRWPKTAQVVIGAQFGDEGKGKISDYYAAAFGTDGIVARFNGGAQAGHTVVTPDGLRHVFGHIGSGALAGATPERTSRSGLRATIGVITGVKSRVSFW